MIFNGEAAKSMLKDSLYHNGKSRSKGYFKEDDIWIAFDNSTGNCNVEEFSTEGQAIAWILNYFEISEISDFKIYKLFNRLYYIKKEGFLIVFMNDNEVSTKLLNFSV